MEFNSATIAHQNNKAVTFVVIVTVLVSHKLVGNQFDLETAPAVLIMSLAVSFFSLCL